MRKLSWAILILSISYPAFSQKKDSAITFKKLGDSINVILREQNIPGLMLGIARKDTILFSGGFGYADIAAKRMVTGGTLFRLGSITKMFVSLGILQLIREGKLHLLDELKKVAPEVPFENKWESVHPVRIVHLLEHTTGFDDMQLNRMCSSDPKEYKGMEMMLIQKNSFKCRWKPGERTSYSNPGYVILGYIIYKLTGKNYDQYLTENLLQPLGMSHSNFNLGSKLPEQDAKEYVPANGKLKEVPSVISLMGPAGSLWSCSDDMVKFLLLFLHNGQPIFTDSIITEMETPHSSLAAQKGLLSTYALGNYTTRFFNKDVYKGHNGLLGTCYSSFIYNRKKGVGFVLASNGNNPNFQLESLLTDYVEQDEPEQKIDTNALDIAAIAPFLGYYRYESPRNKIAGFKDKLLMGSRVYLENNALYLNPFIGERIKLFQNSPGIFFKEDFNTPTIVFTKNEEGKNVAIIDGGYYEQGTYVAVAGKIWVTFIALLFVVSACCAGIVAILLALTGRVKRAKILMPILPLLATAALAWAVLNLLEVQAKTYLLSELTNINMRTVIIFAGTLCFAVFSLLHLTLVLRNFRGFKNKWRTSYWLFTALSLIYILAILFQNGWIGMRTWAM